MSKKWKNKAQKETKPKQNKTKIKKPQKAERAK